jgi:choline kinase
MSVLVAATAVREGTLLTMADHLLSDRLIARFLGEAPAEAALSLAIDRRLGNPDVDEADVTRVRTEAGRVRAIGKSLKVYDAYDTGLFRIGIDLLDALASLPAEQASLSAGVSILAARGQAAAVDIGDARWLDVDDPRALLRAEATWGAS